MLESFFDAFGSLFASGPGLLILAALAGLIPLVWDVGYLQGSLTSWTDTEFVGVHYRISWVKYSLGSHDFCFFHCRMKLFLSLIHI